MSVHAFVDESKARGFFLVVAVVPPRSLDSARAAMRRLCLPGQSRIHFTKEGQRRRSVIVDQICALPVDLHVFDATSLANEKVARRACLVGLVQTLGELGGQRLVLEQDESLVTFDQAVLYAAVRQLNLADSLTYEHLPARSEPLLWIADAAAWCWSRGGAWRERIKPRVRAAYRL